MEFIDRIEERVGVSFMYIHLNKHTIISLYAPFICCLFLIIISFLFWGGGGVYFFLLRRAWVTSIVAQLFRQLGFPPLCIVILFYSLHSCQFYFLLRLDWFRVFHLYIYIGQTDHFFFLKNWVKKECNPPTQSRLHSDIWLFIINIEYSIDGKSECNQISINAWW